MIRSIPLKIQKKMVKSTSQREGFVREVAFIVVRRSSRVANLMQWALPSTPLRQRSVEL
jgi:hypothetical protein